MMARAVRKLCCMRGIVVIAFIIGLAHSRRLSADEAATTNSPAPEASAVISKQSSNVVLSRELISATKQLEDLLRLQQNLSNAKSDMDSPWETLKTPPEGLKARLERVIEDLNAIRDKDLNDLRKSLQEARVAPSTNDTATGTTGHPGPPEPAPPPPDEPGRLPAPPVEDAPAPKPPACDEQSLGCGGNQGETISSNPLPAISERHADQSQKLKELVSRGRLILHIAKEQVDSSKEKVRDVSYDISRARDTVDSHASALRRARRQLNSAESAVSSLAASDSARLSVVDLSDFSFREALRPYQSLAPRAPLPWDGIDDYGASPSYGGRDVNLPYEISLIDNIEKSIKGVQRDAERSLKDVAELQTEDIYRRVDKGLYKGASKHSRLDPAGASPKV
jgi:archaellum component FlaC